MAAAAVAVITSTVVVYGQRVAPSRLGTAAARLAAVGYAVPGAVIAVAIYVPLVWVDRRLIAAVRRAVRAGHRPAVHRNRARPGRRLRGALPRAGVLRAGVADGADPAEPGRRRARAGRRPGRVLTAVHLPLLWPGVATAALLVMVEVIKELPATALLRPLGRDTLAIMTWEATKDARFDTAALPALLIVAVGLLPVATLVRLRDAAGRSGPDRSGRPVRSARSRRARR